MKDDINKIETVIDPITLWRLIHGGDPSPDVIRVTAALAIYSIAANLEGGEKIKAAAGDLLIKQIGQGGRAVASA